MLLIGMYFCPFFILELFIMHCPAWLYTAEHEMFTLNWLVLSTHLIIRKCKRDVFKVYKSLCWPFFENIKGWIYCCYTLCRGDVIQCLGTYKLSQKNREVTFPRARSLRTLFYYGCRLFSYFLMPSSSCVCKSSTELKTDSRVWHLNTWSSA